MRKKQYKKWDYELLHKTALMYETRWAFQKGSPNAYKASQRRGILNDICGHMNYDLTYWSDEMIHAEALKYNSRKEFEKGNRNAYSACLRRGILNNVCKHMEPPTHWKKSHCVYFIEIFTSKNELYYYVGQTCDLERRLRKHFRDKVSDSPVFDFLNKTPVKYKKHYVVEDNLTYEESLALEKDTIKNLKNRGVRLLNKELL